MLQQPHQQMQGYHNKYNKFPECNRAALKGMNQQVTYPQQMQGGYPAATTNAGRRIDKNKEDSYRGSFFYYNI